MNNYEEDTTHFINFFQNQLRVLETAKFASNGSLFRKICYVAILDSLAKTVYPRSNNRERFTTLIREFCDWPYYNRVSLIHLVQLLKLAPDPDLAKVKKFALDEIRKWTEGCEYKLDSDPEFTTVESLWPKQKEFRQPLSGVSLESLCHDNLIYTYRNNLVHEVHSPGSGFEWADEKEPLYHQMTHSDDVTSEERWELVYPVAFFHSLCENAVGKLTDYYKANELNPLSVFRFGSYWIEELNR